MCPPREGAAEHFSLGACRTRAESGVRRLPCYGGLELTVFAALRFFQMPPYR